MTLKLAGVRAVLFDLDGTLIDSAPDLAASLNRVLGNHGLGPLRLTAVIGMIGNGIRKLVERGFVACGRRLEDAALDAAYAEMIETYGAHLTDETILLPGARETIAALRDAGLPLGLVTNKPQRETEAIVAHFGLGAFFAAVVGGDAGIEKKPAPDMLLAALSHLGVSASEAVMVGDSMADVKSARAAGARAILVRGGYTTVPVEDLDADAVLDRLDELPALISKA